jgi:hypothetical protein
MVRVLALVALLVAIGMLRPETGVAGKVALGALFVGCLFVAAWMTRVANKRRERPADENQQPGAHQGGPSFGEVPGHLGAAWDLGGDEDVTLGQQQSGRPRR